MVAITSACEQMESIVKLAAFMLNHQYFTMDCGNDAAFIKGLRMAVRVAGCENRHVTICIKVSSKRKTISFNSYPFFKK